MMDDIAPEGQTLFTAKRSARSWLKWSPRLGITHRLERKSVIVSDFTQIFEAGGRAGVAGAHIHLQKHRARAGGVGPELGGPFGGLPIGDAGVREPAGREDRRIG